MRLDGKIPAKGVGLKIKKPYLKNRFNNSELDIDMSFSLRQITDDRFELKGEWYIPDKPEQKIFGILKYEKGTATLEIQGLFDGIDLRSDEPFDSKIILGNSPGLRGVTLVDCYLTSSNNTSTTFTSHMIFTNCIFKNKNEIKFKGCFVHFRYLEQWIRLSGLTITHTIELGLKTEFKHPDKINMKISNYLDVAISSGWSTSNIVNTFSDFTINQTKSFEIMPKNEIGFEELRNIITTLQRFLTFAIDEPTHHEKIICYQDANKKFENEIGMFYDSITSLLFQTKKKYVIKKSYSFMTILEKTLRKFFKIGLELQKNMNLPYVLFQQ